MAKVIQIRDVDDATHAALTRAAQRHRLSLNGFLRRELDALALAAESVEHNRDVVSASKAAIGRQVPREAITSAVADGRRE